MEPVKTFAELRQLNVNEHIERKGNLAYLSWAWAVDTLLLQDSMATWEFKAPQQFGQTMMVFCEVTALGKTMKMHLPVMDNMNKAIVNPDARKVSDAMMRCLAKCIACFGIGLYIYAGEDLPDGEDAGEPARPSTSFSPPPVSAPKLQVVPTGDASDDGAFVVTIGKKYAGKMLRDIPRNDIEGYVNWLEGDAVKKNKPISPEVIQLKSAVEKYFNAPF